MRSGMLRNEELREAWISTIQAEDYEAHMAAMGQAQANAALIAEYLLARAPFRDASLLFLGAGTGQMFEFVSPQILLPYQTTFADINAGFLERLDRRLTSTVGLRYRTLVDDVEQTKLKPGFQTILAVLLLEHVDWKRAVEAMCALATAEIFVVIQENPETLASAMTQNRSVPGTMNIFREIHPRLVPRGDLEREFVRQGFRLGYASQELVVDDKKMLALGFGRS
jgi:hypothetical protein